MTDGWEDEGGKVLCKCPVCGRMVEYLIDTDMSERCVFCWLRAKAQNQPQDVVINEKYRDKL